MFQFSEKVRHYNKGRVRAEKNLAGKVNGDGWCVPASSIRLWLDERMFQFSKKVADYKRSETGQVAKKKSVKRDVDQIETTAALRSFTETSIHPHAVVIVPVGGLEPATKTTFTKEIEKSGASDTALTQTSAESECATEQDHHPGRDMATGKQSDDVERGEGGSVVGQTRISRWVCTNAEFWAKAGRLERL